ncbi:hypothetical protein K2173_005391 [Erythroxylum novogranatense]|uniref:Cytochrome P450 n=1 Tax=Erythroxylum novogranatense TaxID=1862640 RepID=A0AAV8TBL4_9ROSI|nr:hypothetical protein K2173_005391 [Erythroxylum novogranatense]
MEKTLLNLFVSIATLIIFWFWWKVKKIKKDLAPLLPGPRGLPIVGYLPFLGQDIHRDFTELASVYGPIYKLCLGNKMCLVISSPNLVKEVVRDQDKIFANRDLPLAARISSLGANDIVWSPYNSEWRKMRKIFVREILSNKNINACYGLRKQEIKKSTRHVYDKIGQPIDIGQLAFMTSMNALMSILWGHTLEGEEDFKAAIEFRNLCLEMMVVIGKPNISDYIPMLARLDLQGLERKVRKISVGVENFLNSLISRCSNSIDNKQDQGETNELKRDILQFLMKHKDHEDASKSITSSQLKGILLDTVIGGTDTTSTMVEWTMAELMLHQDVMLKVYEELDKVVGSNNSVEEFHLPHLCYLEAVVKETFRLHPALPYLIPRRPSETCTLAGYTIPKGSTIFVNVYAIHRDPVLWQNPLEFRPERFLSEETGNFDFSGANFQYLPFGSGRRICAGLPLAEKMLMYQLASFLHPFDWKLPSNDTELDLSDKAGIVVKIRKPLIAIPTPRLPNPDLY